MFIFEPSRLHRVLIASGRSTLLNYVRILSLCEFNRKIIKAVCHEAKLSFDSTRSNWSKFLMIFFSLLFQTEDEGNHGNDDTRCFILSTLASQGRSKVHCILCEEKMPVFDRYPLVDGTFFLSPRQHAKTCIEVSYFLKA